MAHPGALRERALRYFLTGKSLERIAADMGLTKSTLARWSKRGGWQAMRLQQDQLRSETAALVMDMTQAARASKDPQQAYAAMQAMRLAGLAAPALVATPLHIAQALLDVVANHQAFAALVRKHRDELVTLILNAAEKLESAK